MLSLFITLLPGFCFRLCPRLVQKQALHFCVQVWADAAPTALSSLKQRKDNTAVSFYLDGYFRAIYNSPLPTLCGATLKYVLWPSRWNYIRRHEKFWKRKLFFSLHNKCCSLCLLGSSSRLRFCRPYLSALERASGFIFGRAQTENNVFVVYCAVVTRIKCSRLLTSPPCVQIFPCMRFCSIMKACCKIIWDGGASLWLKRNTIAFFKKEDLVR